MARIRTIKPEFAHSESMGRVSRNARLTFVLLWTIADDYGRLRGNNALIASLLYPYDDDAKVLVGQWLEELENEGCIVRYSVNGSSYVAVTHWDDHQKIDRPTPSKLPELPDNFASPRESFARTRESFENATDHVANDAQVHTKPTQAGQFEPKSEILARPREDSSNPREVVDDTRPSRAVMTGTGTRIRNGYGPGPGTREPEKIPEAFERPTLEQVVEKFQVTGVSIEWAKEFWTEYEVKEWVSGDNEPLRNWRAAVMPWINRRRTRQFQEKRAESSGPVAPKSTDTYTADDLAYTAQLAKEEQERINRERRERIEAKRKAEAASV